MPNKLKLPEGITLQTLQKYWETSYREYWRSFRKMVLLDATDRSRMWDALKAKFPSYQILPDTNFVTYVKCNIAASIYTVCKSARILPTSREDKDVVMNLNMALDHYWGVLNVGSFQRKAGDRAALLNLGLTQVGYDSDNKRPILKNIDPMKFMRDPYSPSLDESPYCITYETTHESVLKRITAYEEGMKTYTANAPANTQTVEAYRDRPLDATAQSQAGYRKLIMYWIRDGKKVHEIHTIDNEHVILVKEDIKPAGMFPFAELYCNDPGEDLIGTSEPAKVFANSVAYNLLNAVLLTSEYKNQRPPKFINAAAGLNIETFIKHGNEADMTFIVNGDAQRAVHYHQYPQPSVAAPIAMQRLANDVQLVSGVDPRYTGRDTGSVLTTGGIESMLNQVTMIDTTKVANYEDYTRRLTQLILGNMVEFLPERSYFIKNPKDGTFSSFSVKFQEIQKNKAVFDYEINISSELPKNKQRVAQLANTLMEKQLQYAQMGQKVDLITPEEWLMLQDLPIMEYMQERMKIQRTANYQQRVTEILTMFAEMTKSGIPPTDAIEMVASQLQAEDTPMMNGQPEIPAVVQEDMAPVQNMV